MKRAQQSGFLTEKALRRAAESLPTPCYLYDERTLRASARRLNAAFSRAGRFREYFPMYLNFNPAILRILRDEGCGVLCVSQTELMIAERCGFSGREVLYAPVTREEQAERLALALGAVWLLDGPQVLPEAPPAAALLCWNPGGRLTANGKTFASFDRSKYGMPENALLALAQTLRGFGVEELGVTLRVSARELEQDYYPAAALALFGLSRRMLEKTGIAARFCCLGSGLGYSCRAEYPEPEPERCAEDIAALLQELPGELADLELQSVVGERLTADCGWYLMRAEAVKDRECPLVLTDGSCGQFLRLSELGAYRRLSVPGRAEDGARIACDVAGSDTLQRARFAERRPLPPVKPGELLAVHGAGAGAASLTVRTSGALPCAEYLLTREGTVRLIGKGWEPEDFLGSLIFG